MPNSGPPHPFENQKEVQLQRAETAGNTRSSGRRISGGRKRLMAFLWVVTGNASKAAMVSGISLRTFQTLMQKKEEWAELVQMARDFRAQQTEVLEGDKVMRAVQGTIDFLVQDSGRGVQMELKRIMNKLEKEVIDVETGEHRQVALNDKEREWLLKVFQTTFGQAAMLRGITNTSGEPDQYAQFNQRLAKEIVLMAASTGKLAIPEGGDASELISEMLNQPVEWEAKPPKSGQWTNPESLIPSGNGDSYHGNGSDVKETDNEEEE